MRIPALLLSFLNTLLPFAAHADVKIVTPFKGMKIISTAKTDMSESNVLNYCARLGYEYNGCLKNHEKVLLASLIGHIRKAARMTDQKPDHSPNSLSDDELMSIYHHGELSGMSGKGFLTCPFLDDSIRLEVWFQGYLELPIVRRG